MSEARRMLSSAMPGSRAHKERQIRLAESVENIIGARWKISPWAWQRKHIEWLLDIATSNWSAKRKYEAWLVIRAIFVLRGKTQLVEQLAKRANAYYIRPNGKIGVMSARGRKSRVKLYSS